MGNNIIFNKKLEDYNKKYRNGRYRLLKYTKKEVEQYDKLANQTFKTKNYLLRGRKWALIGDTYYEIPRAPRMIWLRNINAGAKAVTCALLGGAVAGGAGYGIYAAIANKQPVKPDPGPTPVIHVPVVVKPEVEQTATVSEFVENADGDAVGTLEAKQEGMEVVSVTGSYGDHDLTNDEAHYDRQNHRYTVKQAARRLYETETCTLTIRAVAVAERLSLELNTDRIEFKLGEQAPKLTAIITGDSGNASFRCEDTSIATVTSSGNDCQITALKAGTTKIIASYLYLTKECTLVVNPESTIEIVLSPEALSLNLDTVEIKTISASLTPSGTEGDVRFSLEEGADTYISIKEIGSNQCEVTPKAATPQESPAIIKATFGTATKTCPVTVTSSHVTKHTVNLSPVPAKGGEANGGGEHDENSYVHIWAASSDSYEFSGWYDSETGGTQISSNPDYLIEHLTSDLNYYARFTESAVGEEKVNIKISQLSGKGGSGTFTGQGKHVKKSGSDIIVTAKPDENSKFDGWYSDKGGKYKLSYEEIYKINPESITSTEYEIYAKFSPKSEKVNINATCDPEGSGTIEGAGQYDLNASLTLKATSIDTESYQFLYWTDDEAPETHIEGASIQVTATKDKSYTAHFKDIRPSYTVAAHCDSTKGTVSVTPDTGTVKKGESATFTCTPNKSHDFKGWYDNESFTGDPKSTESEYTINNITKDTNLYAKIEPHTVTSIKIASFHNLDIDTTSTKIGCYEDDTENEAWVDWSTNVSKDLLDIDEDGYLQIKDPKATTISATIKAKLKISPYCEDTFEIELSTDPTQGYLDTDQLKEGKIKVGGNHNITKLVIPSRYWDSSKEGDDKWVTQTSIVDNAFKSVSNIQSVYIPSSITSIGTYAFFKPDEGTTPNLNSVVFENKTGWEIDGTSVDPSDLADPSNAATLILNNLEKTWTKH